MPSGVARDQGHPAGQRLDPHETEPLGVGQKENAVAGAIDIGHLGGSEGVDQQRDPALQRRGADPAPHLLEELRLRGVPGCRDGQMAVGGSEERAGESIQNPRDSLAPHDPPRREEHGCALPATELPSYLPGGGAGGEAVDVDAMANQVELAGRSAATQRPVVEAPARGDRGVVRPALEHELPEGELHLVAPHPGDPALLARDRRIVVGEHYRRRPRERLRDQSHGNARQDVLNVDHVGPEALELAVEGDERAQRRPRRVEVAEAGHAGYRERIVVVVPVVRRQLGGEDDDLVSPVPQMLPQAVGVRLATSDQGVESPADDADLQVRLRLGDYASGTCST